MSAPMQAMIVDGRSVAFLEGGDATASRVVVLVHAFPAGVRQLAPQLAAWPGWRLIAPALPGFDGSARLETPTVDAYARHVLALLVVGDEDRLTPPPEMEHLARALPRSRFVRLPAAGHLANVENPDAFNAAVGQFLGALR